MLDFFGSLAPRFGQSALRVRDEIQIRPCAAGIGYRRRDFGAGEEAERCDSLPCCAKVKWADLDFGGRFLTVNRNFVRGVITTPKNHQGRRVDMSMQLADALVAPRLQQKAYALKHGAELPDIVFPSRLGTLLDDANVRHIFKRILEKAEIRQIRFHDLRPPSRLSCSRARASRT